MPAMLDPPADSFPIWVSEHTLIHTPGLPFTSCTNQRLSPVNPPTTFQGYPALVYAALSVRMDERSLPF